MSEERVDVATWAATLFGFNSERVDKYLKNAALLLDIRYIQNSCLRHMLDILSEAFSCATLQLIRANTIVAPEKQIIGVSFQILSMSPFANHLNIPRLLTCAVIRTQVKNQRIAKT